MEDVDSGLHGLFSLHALNKRLRTFSCNLEKTDRVLPFPLCWSGWLALKIHSYSWKNDPGFQVDRSSDLSIMCLQRTFHVSRWLHSKQQRWFWVLFYVERVFLLCHCLLDFLCDCWFISPVSHQPSHCLSRCCPSLDFFGFLPACIGFVCLPVSPQAASHTVSHEQGFI